jgi:enoyl-CoA hydratase
VSSNEPVVRYQVEGHVATLTMNRPDVANAQNSALIDELDACSDRADADDEVRVVILAGAGKHFSAGHDLKAIVGNEGADDEWVAMRETPEGKFHHEQIMYVDRCRKIHDFRKPTIAAVQGKCVAAGLMLACMCDLIVASDDASFSNPVLRMTGAGVELLVEPWELGIRKAKEFLLAAEELDAAEAWRLGLVNKVVPRADLMARTRELAERVALVPPVTAQVVKDSLNNVGELMGKGASWRYHFMAHQWAHNTATALSALEQRKQMGSMKEVFAARDRGDAAGDAGGGAAGDAAGGTSADAPPAKG